MPGGRDHIKRHPRGINALAVNEGFGAAAVLGQERAHGGTGALDKAVNTGGVVAVSMGDEHELDAARDGDQRIQMLVVGGTRIDHDGATAPNEIAICSGEGHRARVRGAQAAHAVGKLKRKCIHHAVSVVGSTNSS